METLLAVGLTASFLGNLYQHYKTKKSKPIAQDARQLLHDLTKGGAVVRVSVIDPEGLMFYRTRQ